MAWCGLIFSIPDEISGKLADHKKNANALASVKAQSRDMIGLHQKHTVELQVQREKMWKEAWNRQKEIFVWPKGYSSNQLADLTNYKFGNEIPNRPNATLFQFSTPEVYHKEYQDLIKELDPMKFRGDDWTKVLRYVPHPWPRNPSSEDLVLAMEDLWVQRDILLGIHKVNVDAAEFKRIPFKTPDGKDAKDDPFHRLFRSRIWELDLKIVDKGNDRELQGTLKNISSTLQVTGIDNSMKLKLRFNKDEKSDFICVVEGVSAEPGQSLAIKPLRKKGEADQNVVPPGQTDFGKMELYSVVQKFDLRTVPVKRIEFLVLGKLADRISALPLKMAKFSEKPEVKKEEPKGGGAMGMGVGAMGGGVMGMKGVLGAPMGFGGGGGGFTGQGGGNTATQTDKTANGFDRQRYIDVTEQVRRLPYAVSVVTDQTYLKDILESLANTKLRFQTAQVDLSKFHGTLNYGNSSTASDDRSGVVTNSREDQFSANLLELSAYGILSIYERFPEGKAGKQSEPAKKQSPSEKGANNPAPPISKEPAPMTPKEPAPTTPKEPAPTTPKDSTPPAPKK